MSKPDDTMTNTDFDRTTADARCRELETRLRAAQQEGNEALRTAQEEREARLTVIAVNGARRERDRHAKTDGESVDDDGGDDGMGESWWADWPKTGPLARYGRHYRPRTRAIPPVDV
jgi:hypothetical protein